MSSDYGAVQQCPQCSGALLRAERRMSLAIEAARDSESDARAMLRERDAELVRARNGDPSHRHIQGRPSKDAICTLASHRVDAVKAERAAEAHTAAARAFQRDAIAAAHEIAEAGRRLLIGCTLCGRPALPANGRVAA